MGTDDRVRALEAQVRQLTRCARIIAATGFLACSGGILAVMAGAARPPASIRAGEFVLVDPDGTPKGIWRVSNRGDSVLALGSPEIGGPFPAVLTVESNGEPTLDLSSPNGDAKASLMVTRDGPLLHLDQRNASLIGRVIDGNRPSLEFRDNTQRVIHRLPPPADTKR